MGCSQVTVYFWTAVHPHLTRTWKFDDENFRRKTNKQVWSLARLKTRPPQHVPEGYIGGCRATDRTLSFSKEKGKHSPLTSMLHAMSTHALEFLQIQKRIKITVPPSAFLGKGKATLYSQCTNLCLLCSDVVNYFLGHKYCIFLNWCCDVITCYTNISYVMLKPQFTRPSN